ncbi:uncharacterized protein HD556DRAFT_1308838 [Suillus plorans]|uniref:Uncharacterized protein n=1 Tax=Suillus plorans TaxID=116603 RepID=A0A9P7DGD1_9AGAM|nr:uncharacterized protein HD556DRAFT_1308838 [Suillus plorans]KAG1793114.1 hypothetical protein HD556DRAFT_1308838 [Suillus plorans]
MPRSTARPLGHQNLSLDMMPVIAASSSNETTFYVYLSSETDSWGITAPSNTADPTTWPVQWAIPPHYEKNNETPRSSPLMAVTDCHRARIPVNSCLMLETILSPTFCVQAAANISRSRFNAWTAITAKQASSVIAREGRRHIKDFQANEVILTQRVSLVMSFRAPTLTDFVVRSAFRGHKIQPVPKPLDAMVFIRVHAWGIKICARRSDARDVGMYELLSTRQLE